MWFYVKWLGVRLYLLYPVALYAIGFKFLYCNLFGLLCWLWASIKTPPWMKAVSCSFFNCHLPWLHWSSVYCKVVGIKPFYNFMIKSKSFSESLGYDPTVSKGVCFLFSWDSKKRQLEQEKCPPFWWDKALGERNLCSGGCSKLISQWLLLSFPLQSH